MSREDLLRQMLAVKRRYDPELHDFDARELKLYMADASDVDAELISAAIQLAPSLLEERDAALAEVRRLRLQLAAVHEAAYQAVITATVALQASKQVES